MRDADHTLNINIQRESFVIRDVLCKIYLPERLSDSIRLHFFLSPTQLNAIRDSFEFSVEGEIKDSDDFVRTRILSCKVYREKTFFRDLPSGISEIEIVATPRDLEIEDFTYGDDKGSEYAKNTRGAFWLTRSNLLSPDKKLKPSYTGEVSVDLLKKLEFKLENGYQLTFDKHYRYKKCDNNDLITFSELVAEVEFDGTKSEIALNVEYVDDFLSLVSFAERQRCVCLGWYASDSKGFIRHYRRKMAIPETPNDRPHLILIDRKDFDTFINIAYNSFIRLEPRTILRDAIQKTIFHNSGTIESHFMSLYSALETIVLFFRRNQNIPEFVFPEDSQEWKQIYDDLKKWLENHPKLKSDKEKTKLICGKLKELNRVSFRNGFKKLIKTFSINLDDLWPVLHGSDGASLADIRNMLVHGEVFNPIQYQSLMVASEHLRWIVERLLLTLLGWDVLRSTVRDEFLSTKIEFNKNWKANREILSSKFDAYNNVIRIRVAR